MITEPAGIKFDGLTQLHEMLDVLFGNAYFTFDNCFYLQLVGLFIMGCKPSPLGAIIRSTICKKREGKKKPLSRSGLGNRERII